MLDLVPLDFSVELSVALVPTDYQRDVHILFRLVFQAGFGLEDLLFQALYFPKRLSVIQTEHQNEDITCGEENQYLERLFQKKKSAYPLLQQNVGELIKKQQLYISVQIVTKCFIRCYTVQVQSSKAPNVPRAFFRFSKEHRLPVSMDSLLIAGNGWFPDVSNRSSW